MACLSLSELVEVQGPWVHEITQGKEKKETPCLHLYLMSITMESSVVYCLIYVTTDKSGPWSHGPVPVGQRPLCLSKF